MVWSCHHWEEAILHQVIFCLWCQSFSSEKADINYAKSFSFHHQLSRYCFTLSVSYNEQCASPEQPNTAATTPKLSVCLAVITGWFLVFLGDQANPLRTPVPFLARLTASQLSFFLYCTFLSRLRKLKINFKKWENL